LIHAKKTLEYISATSLAPNGSNRLQNISNDDELNQMRKYITDNPFSAGNHHDKNELDFIINYDIKYRMGRDSGDEEVQ